MIPIRGQRYYTFTTDGQLMECENSFSKSDLFNIAHAICYPTREIAKKEFKRSMGIIAHAIEIAEHGEPKNVEFKKFNDIKEKEPQ